MENKNVGSDKETNFPRKSSNFDFLFLEESEFYSNYLVTIKTSNKKTTIEKIQEINEPKNIESLKNEKLDLAIVYYTDKTRFKTQDVDNVAKIVLDALKKSKKFSGFFKDDSQIVRLLVYKKLKREIKDHDNHEVLVSFRKHNPSKNMILSDYTCIPEHHSSFVDKFFKHFPNNFDIKIKRKISIALCKLTKKDSHLFKNDVHEVALSSRFACYLSDLFTDYDVDVEYNRNLYDAKRSSEGQIVRPDIIVHKRGTDNNYLVFEIKKKGNNNSIDEDERKLKDYTSRNNSNNDTNIKKLKYKYGFLILFGSKSPYVKKICIFENGKEIHC